MGQADGATLSDTCFNNGSREFPPPDADPVLVIGVEGFVGIQNEVGDVGSLERLPHVLVVDARERSREVKKDRAAVGVVVIGIQGGDIDVKDVFDD